MVKLNPTFLMENGKEKFAVLSIKDYAAIREALEDAEDARILEEAIRRDAGGLRIAFAEVKRQLAAQRRATALRGRAENGADLRAIERSKKRNAGKPPIPHERVMRDFGLIPGRKKRKV